MDKKESETWQEYAWRRQMEMVEIAYNEALERAAQLVESDSNIHTLDANRLSAKIRALKEG